DIAKERNCGITVEAKAIPIRQETIEVCEFYGLNPYMLESFGATLILERPENVRDKLMELAKSQIPATRIGNLTEGHDCIVTNGERTTYIKPPKEDELCKLQ
ncbi:MAG: hydrogenase maturation factor, partial [Lachnospiraceae bacterium]|nr:hydrogenase maturation factor [Lachnospiraceae bacterium]